MKRSVSKRLKNPFFPAAFIMAADILLLLFAAVVRALRDKFPPVCTYADGVGISEKCGADTAIMIAAVVGLAAAAALAGFIFAGAALWGREDGSTGLRVVTGAVMLGLSAAAACFSMYVVRGEQPSASEYSGFIDGRGHVVIIVEEEYSKENILKVYLLDDEQNEAFRLTALPLMERTQGSDFDSRYNLSWITEEVLTLGFVDGGAYRSLSIPAKIPSAEAQTQEAENE